MCPIFFLMIKSKNIFYLFSFFWFFLALPTLAADNLIKIKGDSAVYYLDSENNRHLFPTGSVYKSWYSDFSGVRTISPEEISRHNLGKNVTLRPGVKIATFATVPNFYAVEPGGVLRRFVKDDLPEKIFGPDWSRRVVKIPDAFFGDYILGEEIKSRVDLPDGLVYQLAEDEKYYYKNTNLLQPFDSLESVLANNFKKDDIVQSALNFDHRQKEIQGFSSRIFNPAASPAVSTADCENKKFKAAVVLLAKEKPSAEELEKLNTIKKRAEENFVWATKGLAKLDLSLPVMVLSGDEKLFFTDIDGQKKPDNEAINIFYDQNQDIFDFIILYNNSVQNESVIAKYLMVSNNFFGTGNNQLRSADAFGSRGKLKGIANMGNLDKYSIDSQDVLNTSANYIIHEILHHFSGRAIFMDEKNEISYTLLSKDKAHWNMFVDFISPLGGSGWQENGDSAFSNKTALAGGVSKRALSDLDLYFMGLLPAPYVPPIKYLEPDIPDAVGNVVKGKIKEVTIDQIIKTMGEWGCNLR